MPNTNLETRREFTRRSDRIEELVSRIESSGDLATRAVAQELLQAVIELHGVALERIVDAVSSIPEGCAALESLAEDELVSGVLSLHDIHPVALEARIESAIETTRPYLKSHGGDVELASIKDGTVHLLLHGTCGSCSSSVETLKQTVETAIYSVAPEVFSVVADPSPKPAHPGLVTLQAH